MPRRGENIYKRKDGRWEGRLIRGHHPNGKAIYQYVYGKSYSEAKRKLLDLRSRRNVGADTVNQRVKYKDILNEWLIMSQIRTKESTFSHYTHLSKLHILPFLGEIPIEHLTTKIVEDHILMLLSSGRIDGTLPCLPLWIRQWLPECLRWSCTASWALWSVTDRKRVLPSQLPST